jgi:hypothetical protein
MVNLGNIETLNRFQPIVPCLQPVADSPYRKLKRFGLQGGLSAGMANH